MYQPYHNAGGETTAHTAMKAMVDRGHDVTVVFRPQNETEGDKCPDIYEYEGVKCIKSPLNTAQAFIKDVITRIDPDLLITHLDLTTLAMQLSLDTHKPLAHWVHNTMSLDVFHVSPQKCQLAIFNSNWVAEFYKWKGPQIVIHPTVEPDRYRCEKGTKITLVNPTPGKGADQFYQLSKMLPDYEFLTVKSVYGEQIAVPNISAHLHPNVETMEHTADIREALRKTKVLLMPSQYESYGRVAVEAACSGIPTIAHPTPGLLEALGDAGIFCDRDDLPSWKNAIERLMTDDVYYRKRSDLALELANSLDPESEFDRLEEALLVTSRAFNQEDVMERVLYANRRFGKKPDGSLSDQMHECRSLVCGGPGAPIPFECLEEAKALGYADIPADQPSEKTEILLDTKALTEAPENKAIQEPEQKKTRKRKTA